MLYKMFVTASSALRDLGKSVAGSGGGRVLCQRLYSNAEVESSMGFGGWGGFGEPFSGLLTLRVVEKRRRPVAEAARLRRRADIIWMRKKKSWNLQ